MNKMQKAISTMAKLDNDWINTRGSRETFRATRIFTKEVLKDLFGNHYTYDRVMWLICKRRKEF